MRQEVFRMERVSYTEQGVKKLENFNIQIYAGEVMGLIPVNAHGKNAILKLLQNNLPLYDGYIYYNGELVNSWRGAVKKNNRVSVIQTQNRLVNGMTVADNIFVLRQGFRQYFLKTPLLKKQLIPFMQDIDMDISADTRVEKLSAFERVVVELLRAIVGGYHLIVLDEISIFVSESEMKKLYQIMRHYTAQGFSFLYISSHFEEIERICDRTGFLCNGRLQKIVQKPDMSRKNLREYLQGYDKNVWGYPEAGHSRPPGRDIFLEWTLPDISKRQKFSFSVKEGECVTLQAKDNQILQSCISFLTDERSQITMDGRTRNIAADRALSVVSASPTGTMIFPEMSYMDNLCMGLARRMPAVWRGHKVRASIRKEYTDILGKEVFDLPVEELSERQKYQLVYTRIALQKPAVVLLIQPFMGADMPHRRFIWEMLEQLLDKGISLVLLSVNPLDTWLVAHRTLKMDAHGIREETGEFEEHKMLYSFMKS
ncbi:MAG: ATP-binding cassette domain-containing protein [Lachnospiraceae bacterium]|nr:ATP-binding cassette domain-containing protein [Lachnospiraceae bacterium]